MAEGTDLSEGRRRMDDTHSFQGESAVEQDFPHADEPCMEAPPPIDINERRMHVRAYNYWVSLLDGRPFPSIDDLDPGNVEDFGPHSVLLDFTSGPDNAAIPFLGAALRAEGGIDHDIRAIADVPPRTVLSRLTDHYLQIIANRAPVGFEAEYVNHRDVPTMYRGILMPFSSDGDSIDFIYGVINWKGVVETEVAADIRDAVNAALSEPPGMVQNVSVWADGPRADPRDGDDGEDVMAELPADPRLEDRLAVARNSVEALATIDQRSRTALYRALSQAYDFALAAEADSAAYADILAGAGLKSQERAPMTPIAKLVFGTGYDKTRLAEYAAALSYARRHDLAPGGMFGFLEQQDGGLKAIVKAERDLRRPAVKPDRGAKARVALAAAPVLGAIALDGIASDFVSLLGRREPDGTLAIIDIATADTSHLVRASSAHKP